MRVSLVLLTLVMVGCKSETAGVDGGAPQSAMVAGLRKGLEPLPVTDAGPRVVIFNAQGGAQFWAVGRASLQEVIDAVKTSNGEKLATVLERYPAVDPRLVGHARAVKGREPLSEPAELALTGPLSLPFGGVHQPVTLRVAIPPPLAPEGCADVLQKPGSVGQVLAGIGKSRAILLIDEAELVRLDACVGKVVLPPDATEENRRELARMVELLRMGKAREAAVLMGLGS